MNIIFKKWALAVSFLLVSCLQGPWEYYPEEREAYRGIYTIGQVVAGTAPEICFTPLLALDEAMASDFAFYDSAYVEVNGLYESLGERTAVLNPLPERPNCFTPSNEDSYRAVSGEAYTMNAVFVWDSLGDRITSRYSAEAKVPLTFSIEQFFAPLGKGEYLDIIDSFKVKTPVVSFLEYPDDVDNYKFVSDYDESVRGVLTTLRYDNENGGESPYTSMTKYVSDIFGSDSGTLPIKLYSPFDTIARKTFTENMKIGGIKFLDTLTMLNASLPLGKMTIRFYATDQAYVDYINTIVNGNEDPRIVPISNIKNGMGVFSGMIEEDFTWVVDGFYYKYPDIKFQLCRENDWDITECRLSIHSICADSLYLPPECYAPGVQKAFENEESSWSHFLPDTIPLKEKNIAYEDGLKRYCISSNFENTDLANCDDYKQRIQLESSANKYKELLWQWCADRHWDYETYSQCGTGLVSRYRLEKQKSKVLERVIRHWCNLHTDDAQCEYLDL